MDIQVSSNFERLLFDASGRNAPAVKAMMDGLAKDRRFSLPADVLANIRKHFSAARTDEAETVATIKEVYTAQTYVLDPHTAVGVHVARKLKGEGSGPMIALSTAHPAKFPEAVEAAIGVRPKLPPRFSDLLDRRERIARLPASTEAVARFVTEHSRAVGAAA